MLSIKILGPGCYNCYLVERVAGAALAWLKTQFKAKARDLLEGG